MPLKNVRNFKDVITFINHTLIPSLHMDHRYNKDNINSLGFTVDCVSKLVGVPRLRQLRVKPVLRSGNSDVEDVLGKYSLSYSWNNEDTTDYLIGWKTARNTNEIERTAVNPWIWQSSKELSTLPTTGLLAYYSGNGYVTQLGRARPWSWRIFTELVEAGWLDEQTRAVQVEFTTYNVNSNLFCHVTLLFEFAPTGGVFTRSHLNTLRLFLYMTNFEIFVAMCEVMSVIYLIGFAIKEGTDLYKLRLQYFKKFWNLQELLVVLLGFGCVFLYFQRTLEVKNTLGANDAKTGNKFVSFTYVTFWDSTLFYVQAILICLVTIRFWKLLSFSPYMQVPTRTMGKAGTPLLYFVFLLSVVMTGMVFFCYFTFGANVDMMRNFVETFFSLINFSLGRIEFEAMNEADHLFGPVFVSFFIIFIMLILLTLFFTILNRALEETLHEALGADIPETKDMLDYLNHQINLIFRKTSISWVEKVYMNEINQNKTL
ncbi:polycystin-2-like [Tachypleus tridentatus]|uniref:polycystin-2-like n=1 Tax=Tachypleus tridentatus TaxID=6853 RepID=UPI003FD2FA64